MSDFLEEQLRQSLRRREAPADLAAKVSARLPSNRLSGRVIWSGLLAAALACLLVFAGVEKHNQQQQHARQTERQVVFALALAVQKIEHVNAHLQQSAPRVNVPSTSGEKL